MATQGAEAGRASAEGTSRVPLVGRGRDLGLLDAHLWGEGPPVLLLAGEPGIGKSRLMEEAVQRAHAHGVRVLAGGCQRQGGQEPYAPVQEAIHRFIQQRSPAQRRGDLQGCAWLARLLPELAGVADDAVPSQALPADQERRLMFAAVGRLLANVAGPAGTLLVLDDLQWAGPDALDLLGTLARTAPSVPLRLLWAYRDTEVGPQDPLSVLLADLAHADLVARQVVEPLTASEARRLCAVALEGLPATAVALEDRLIEKKGGVPFFVLSWAQGLRAGLPGANVDTVPWRVAVGIHQRVAALPPPAQEALQVAAVMGRALRPALLAAITSVPEEMVLGALEGARRVRLLEETAEGYHFAHDVIREVVEEDVGLARRGLLHRKIAEYLAALPGEPQVEMLAMHFARSDTPGRAAPYLEQAGDRAFRQHAHVAAEEHYRALLTLMGDPSERARAGEKLGRVLHTQGQYDAALAVLEPAAGAYRLVGDLDGLARCVAQIGAVHSARGTFVEGLAALQPQLAAMEGGEPTRGLAALYGVLSDLLCMSARFGEAVAVAAREAATARVLRDERLLADAQAFRGQALSRLPGRRVEALAALEEAIRLGEASQAWATLPFALQDRARIAFHQGDFVACRQYVERAVQIAEQRGDPYQLASFLRSRGMMAFYRGDWDQARHDVERALAIGRAMGMHAISPFAPLLPRLCTWLRETWPRLRAS
jgi:tetratricopeptide (TPR) repeat protein